MRAFRSVQGKILSIIVVVLLVGMTVVSIFSVTSQRNNLLEASRRTLVLNMNMLNLVIRNIMLSGEAPIAENTMASLEELEGFEEIALYRADGSRAFHDFVTLEEVNMNQQLVEFERTPRRDDDPISSDGFREAVRTNAPVQIEDQDARRLDFFFPILNTADCRTCHGTDHFVRGVAHFSLSLDSVFERIDRARSFLLALLGLTTAILAGTLVGALRRIIIRPLSALGTAARRVGTGDLDTEVQLTTGDELADLGHRMNDMITGLKERDRLQTEKTIVETQYRENKKYLDNIQEGLLLIDGDFTIGAQVSRFLHRLFETEDVAGKNLVDFLYPDRRGHKTERAELEEFLQLLFLPVQADPDMIDAVNPLKETTFQIVWEEDGEYHQKEIILDAIFQKVDDDNVMVIFQDLTGVVRARAQADLERRRRESEVESVAAILRAGPSVYRDFVVETREILGDLQGHVGKLEEVDVQRRFFRELHSLKGTARYLELGGIERISHQMEDMVAKVADGKLMIDSGFTTQFNGDLAELTSELEKLDDLSRRFTEFASQAGLSANPSEQLRRELPEMVARLTRDLEKEVSLDLTIAAGDIPHFSTIRNILIHLLRNAIDHGIEPPMERLAAGKSEVGTLTVSLEDTSDSLEMVVKDDGGGLDYSGIERAVRARGLAPEGARLGHSDLVKYLFHPRFSTRDEVSEISGRGVGLDVVKDQIARLKGKISLSSERGRGTTFTIRLPKEGAHA